VNASPSIAACVALTTIIAACAPRSSGDVNGSAADSARRVASYGPNPGPREVPSRDSGLVAPRVPAPPPPRNAMLAFADSLKEPESVRYDPEQDIYFVSNMNGPMLLKDSNGFLSKLKSDGTMGTLKWVESGKNGVTLHSPKGMAIVGDTLWVSDIDHVRGFNRKTGAPIADIDLSTLGATFLNDVAVGGDSAVYITDTELAALPTGNMAHTKTDRIFRIGPDRKASIAIQSDRLGRPNGLVWDAGASHFVVVPFGGDTIMTWKPGATDVSPLVVGIGEFDGVGFANGTLLVASKATNAIHARRGDKLVKIIENVNDPADFEIVLKKGWIAIPLSSSNRVEFYKLP
jgi:hypothetical protein